MHATTKFQVVCIGVCNAKAVMKGRRGGRQRGATFYKDMRGAMAARDDGTTMSGRPGKEEGFYNFFLSVHLRTCQRFEAEKLNNS